MLRQLLFQFVCWYISRYVFQIWTCKWKSQISLVVTMCFDSNLWYLFFSPDGILWPDTELSILHFSLLTSSMVYFWFIRDIMVIDHRFTGPITAQCVAGMWPQDPHFGIVLCMNVSTIWDRIELNTQVLLQAWTRWHLHLYMAKLGTASIYTWQTNKIYKRWPRYLWTKKS